MMSGTYVACSTAPGCGETRFSWLNHLLRNLSRLVSDQPQANFIRQRSQRRTINRRDRDRVIDSPPVLQLFRLDQIHLVEDQQSWEGVELQFAQDSIDRGDLVF